jgi:hypothetical protein
MIDVRPRAVVEQLLKIHGGVGHREQIGTAKAGAISLYWGTYL